MTRDQRPVRGHGGGGGEVHHLLGDPARRVAQRQLALALDLLVRCRRADEDPLAAGLVGRLEDQVVDALERVLELLGIAEQIRLHVGEQRLLLQVVADHLGDEAVDRLVVRDARADRVGKGDRSRPDRTRQPGHAEERIGPELERIDEVVVEPAVDRVDAGEPARGSHVANLVAHNEVTRLDQLDPHLPRQERVLEVRAVRRPRRPDDNRRLVAERGRCLEQGLPQEGRITVDRLHPVTREQLRGQSGHRETVLEHVRDSRRGSDVVLEDPPGSVAVPDEIAAGNRAPDPAGRADSVHRAAEGRAAEHEVPRDDALPQDLLAPVDVADEGVERLDPLAQPGLDQLPFGRGDDAGDEVERERAVSGAAVGAGDLEGDAALGERAVAPAPELEQGHTPHPVEVRDQLACVVTRRVTRREELVGEARRHLVGAGHRRDRSRRGREL